MAKDPLVCLGHILEALGCIEEELEGIDFESFCKRRESRQMLERNLGIISDASRRIPEEFKAREGDVPWKDIARTGNFIHHACHEIDPGILWKTVNGPLNPLKAAVERIEGKCR